MVYFLVKQQIRPFAWNAAAFTNFSLDSACYRQLDKVNKPWNANFMVHPGGRQEGGERDMFLLLQGKTLL
jgi:hypothetical protein